LQQNAKEKFKTDKELLKSEKDAAAEAFEAHKKKLEDTENLYKQVYQTITSSIDLTMSAINGVVSQYYQNENTALDNKLGREQEAYNEKYDLDKEQLEKQKELDLQELEEKSKGDADYAQRKEQIEANYNAAVEKMENDKQEFEKKQQAERAALKKKEFVANQIASAIQTTIATANAVMNVLAIPLLPPWISIPLAVTVGAMGATQVGLILAQPVPEFAEGGIADGLALVGEAGPELVDFRSPARVYNNSQTNNLLSPSVNMSNTFIVRDSKDIDLINMQLGATIQRSVRRI
jgi:Fe2+ transport system protein B